MELYGPSSFHIDYTLELIVTPDQRENTYQTFAFTRRATQNVMVWAILVPSTMAFLAVRYDVCIPIPRSQTLFPHADRGGCRISSIGPGR